MAKILTAYHLSQFHHVECELVSDSTQGIEVGEQYIVTMTEKVDKAPAGPISLIYKCRRRSKKDE